MRDDLRRGADRRVAVLCLLAASMPVAIKMSHSLWSWWLMTMLCYLIIPAFVVREPLAWTASCSDRRLWSSLLAVFALMGPFVWLASGTIPFQAMYPFEKHSLRWETAYVLQFLALEYFYRGVLVQGLSKRFGWDAVWISTIPYCLIHLGKPWPEAFGSIAAGVFLGALSLRTGSILPGFFLHAGVALLMDACATFRAP